MWGLEYLFLFGVPKNKIELLEGKSRCAFPFRDRAEGEAHFADWLDTFCRWKNLEPPSIQTTHDTWRAEFAGFELTLYPRPIDLRIPFSWPLFDAYHRLRFRRDCWPGQPVGLETGRESFQNQSHWDILHNLWQLFGQWESRHGGTHAGRCDVLLTQNTAVAPDQYYFHHFSDENEIGRGGYHRGVPDVVAEVMSACSRWIDRGPRRELYRRAGVRWLWLLDPDMESLEVHELVDRHYRLAGEYGPGDRFTLPWLEGEIVVVGPLFSTQMQRHDSRVSKDERVNVQPPEPIPDWLVPPERPIGLEYLLLLGHPERRFEMWDGRAPCVLPFGSVEEAIHRFRHFLAEACAWERIAVPAVSGDEGECVEVGRFRFSRRGVLVHLEVAVDGAKYRRLLETWDDHDHWDWGD